MKEIKSKHIFIALILTVSLLSTNWYTSYITNRKKDRTMELKDKQIEVLQEGIYLRDSLFEKFYQKRITLTIIKKDSLFEVFLPEMPKNYKKIPKSFKKNPYNKK